MRERTAFHIQNIAAVVAAVGWVGGSVVGVVHLVGIVMFGWTSAHPTWWITLGCMLLMNLGLVGLDVGGRGKP